MDRLDQVGVQLDWGAHLGIAGESGIAIAEAEDALHAIGVSQGQDDRADDVVDSGAEPAARHDAGDHVPRLKAEASPRAGTLESRRRLTAIQIRSELAGARADQNRVVVGGELLAPANEWGVDLAASEAGDLEVARAERSREHEVGIHEPGKATPKSWEVL